MNVSFVDKEAVTMYKKIFAFLIIGWICFGVLLAVSLHDRKEIRQNTATVTVNETILSYEYVENGKYSSYLFNVHIEGNPITLELPDNYITG